jgi:hypothetical protein
LISACSPGPVLAGATSARPVLGDRSKHQPYQSAGRNRTAADAPDRGQCSYSCRSPGAGTYRISVKRSGKAGFGREEAGKTGESHRLVITADLRIRGNPDPYGNVSSPSDHRDQRTRNIIASARRSWSRQLPVSARRRFTFAAGDYDRDSAFGFSSGVGWPGAVHSGWIRGRDRCRQPHECRSGVLSSGCCWQARAVFRSVHLCHCRTWS